jgi:cell shape-determining protein MreC
LKKLNDIIGDKLALWLSTMGCFYIIFALVIVPLFFQQPKGFIGWVTYIVQSVFQGAALPILGYVARVAGEKQENVLNETHDAVMEELAIVKEELGLAREEREQLIKVIENLSNRQA